MVGLEGLTDARGAARDLRSVHGVWIELLVLDEDGSLAEGWIAELQACIDAGPVVTGSEYGDTFSYSWTTEGLPEVDGVFSARFSSTDPEPLHIDAISIGHADGVTMIVLSPITSLRTALEAEEYAATVEFAFDKITG